MAGKSNEIGAKIKKLREDSGLSQEQLAERLGKTRSAVSQYESGKIIPRMGVVEDLAAIFSVKKTDIIGDKTEDDLFASIGIAPLSSDEEQLIRWYRSSTHEGKKAINATAKAMAKL